MNRLIKQVGGEVLKYSDESNLKVFVCGGANKVEETYYNDAFNVGKMIAELGASYVQGGVSDHDTVMGESFYGYVAGGGQSSYFICRSFAKDEVIRDLERIKGAFIVDDIGKLTRAEYLWSDIIIIMPGGIGTLIELLGFIDYKWDYPENQPKIIIYNKQVDGKGYFDSLFNQLRLCGENKFTSENVINENFIVVNSLDEVKNSLKELIK